MTRWGKWKAAHDPAGKRPEHSNSSRFFSAWLFRSVTGVSGSGKSTLVFDILAKGSPNRQEQTGCMEITGIEHVGNIVIFDQSLMGRVQRSNVATYIDVFTQLRQLFAGLPEAKERKLPSTNK